MERRRIHVVATTREGTRRALEAACLTASDEGSRVMLLIPQRSLPVVDPASHYRRVAAACGARLSVIVCACRKAADLLQGMSISGAHVVIGGARRSLWPTREQRLARALSRGGHRVTFVSERGSAAAG
jgi:hypothetical protein